MTTQTNTQQATIAAARRNLDHELKVVWLAFGELLACGQGLSEADKAVLAAVENHTLINERIR